MKGKRNLLKDLLLSISLLAIPCLGFSQHVSDIHIAPESVVAGSPATATVKLSANATGAGLVVNLSSDQTFAQVPATVTIATGKSTGTFSVTTSSVTKESLAKISASSTSTDKHSAALVVKVPFVLEVKELDLKPDALYAGSTATATVKLNGNAPTAGFVLTLASDNSAAQVPATVTVAAGTNATTFAVTTTNVTKTTVATISATDPNSKKATSKLAIVPPFVLKLTELSISPETVYAGKGATGTVHLNGKAPTAGFTVTLTSDSTFAQVPASVLVAAGTNSATFAITTTAVTVASKAKITGTDPNSKSASATLGVLVPFVLKLDRLAIDPGAVPAGKDALGSIFLNGKAPVGGFTITLASDQTFVQVPQTVTLSEGLRSATFKITTSSVTTDGKATVTATDPNGRSATASLGVKAPIVVKLAELGLTPRTVVGGKSATGVVELNAPAPTGGFVIALSSDQTFAQVPASVTVVAGSKTATFSITTTKVTANGKAVIGGKDPNGVKGMATLTVNKA